MQITLDKRASVTVLFYVHEIPWESCAQRHYTLLYTGVCFFFRQLQKCWLEQTRKGQALAEVCCAVTIVCQWPLPSDWLWRPHTRPFSSREPTDRICQEMGYSVPARRWYHGRCSLEPPHYLEQATGHQATLIRPLLKLKSVSRRWTFRDK